mmetsp:Transcript_15829/g.40339  ORF Transcript_15829/g.40339 Transcript_15829/m.40339 type:complete len:189 (+) Transcript_15829:2011-2577(+)
MDVATASISEFFHQAPLGRVKLFIFYHMGISLMCSMFEPDVSAFIAVLGYIAILNNQIEPLNLYLVLLPVSVVVDIIRMSIYSGKFSKSTGGFLVFLVIMKMFGKMLSIWFGYQLSKEWEAGPDTYQDFGGNAQDQAGQPYQAEQGGMGGIQGGGMNTGMPKVVHPSGPDSATIPAYQQGGGYQGGLQ